MPNESGDSFDIDPLHEELDPQKQSLVQYIWDEKYRFENEESLQRTLTRVATTVYANDTSEHLERGFAIMNKGLFLPGGRILAGSGTNRRVTLLNCFVNRAIPDNMEGIADALKDAMLTMQQGGGIGTNFSTLRPAGAILRKTGSTASGPMPFMDMWNSMCGSIMSAGWRRGAMMGVLHCEHPNLLDFITAKKESGKLTNFNLSVLITDAFMEAVRNDDDWMLGFDVPRADGQHIDEIDMANGGVWYGYSVHKAKDIWNTILETTYEYAEPGIIFIDHVNTMNNLQYCETISCTNPCAEQPLPPNGCCLLGSINLARMVSNPFTPEASINYKLLRTTIRVAVRFLDNVIDVTGYPLESQRAEEISKRRIGLGITGLADMLIQLQVRYGSDASITILSDVMDAFMNTAYQTSANLAKERGAFPLYSAEKFPSAPFVSRLSTEVREDINRYGIRNGVLLTIAPTGTTSILLGNVSSGLEPVFAHQSTRKVLQSDGSHKEFISYGYSTLLLAKHQGVEPSKLDYSELPYMATAEEISVEDHIRVLSTCQTFIDASISKTINCPTDISFEAFKNVYSMAFELQCKGCTTYRPSEMRGSILSKGSSKEGNNIQTLLHLSTRPSALHGTTYKIKWPPLDSALYLTINDDENGKPYEMFIASKSAVNIEWTTALSLVVSSFMRLGIDIHFIADEFQQIKSVTESAWIDGTLYGSLVAVIGHFIKLHLAESGSLPNGAPRRTGATKDIAPPEGLTRCSKCHEFAVTHSEGCAKCLSCGDSTCG